MQMPFSDIEYKPSLAVLYQAFDISVCGNLLLFAYVHQYAGILRKLPKLFDHLSLQKISQLYLLLLPEIR